MDSTNRGDSELDRIDVFVIEGRNEREFDFGLFLLSASAFSIFIFLMIYLKIEKGIKNEGSNR